MFDALGDRMKLYEDKESARRFMPLLPIIARLDGKTFSKFTRGLSRPYDKRLTDLMIATMTHLMKETDARVGYTQSDEITLIFYSETHQSQVYMDGRIQKLTSVLASMATSFFVRHLDEALPEKAGAMPMFDCRVWVVPTLEEAANVILWRVHDAIRNSVSIAARSNFSHQELQNKNQKVLKQMLLNKGIVWEDYPDFFKWGTMVHSHKTHRPFTVEEIESLPLKHSARSDPTLIVKRTELNRLSGPFCNVLNRSEYLLGCDPVFKDS